VIDGITVGADNAWQALLDRLAAVAALEPEIPYTLQAELPDCEIEGYRSLARRTSAAPITSAGAGLGRLRARAFTLPG
jgi:hypothetical protein